MTGSSSGAVGFRQCSDSMVVERVGMVVVEWLVAVVVAGLKLCWW